MFCEHDILKTNELISMPIGTSSTRDNDMKLSTLGPKGQRSRSYKVTGQGPTRLKIDLVHSDALF